MEVRITWNVAFIAVCCLATAKLSLALSVRAADDRPELNNCLPPSITNQGVPKGYFIQDAKVSIPCIAKGDGKLSYSWLKDGKPLDLASEASKKLMTTKSGIGSLVIFKAKGKDEGLYQCVVINSCGTSLSTTTLLLHARMSPFPRVSKPTTIVRVLGSSAKLTCKPPASVPKASVAWILTDSADQPMTLDEDAHEGIGFNTVPLNRRVTTDYEGNLYITSVRKEDEQDGKTYVCLAQNLMTRSSNKGEDKVIDTRGNEVAEMGVDMMWHSDTNLTALQGRRAKFKCIFSGQPEPQITWTRVKGGKLDTSRMISDHHELVIKEVQLEDAGEYMCSGINVLKPQAKTHTFVLTVEAAPQWRVQPRDVAVGVEENASFECDAVGNPKPKVEWFVNGKRYAPESSKGVLKGTTLFFKNVDKEDSQVIQCNASNIYGFIWADVYLFVQALPPEITVKPKDDFIVARDKDVTLTCQVTGKPKPKVVWYKGSQPLNHERFQIQDSGDLLIKKTIMKDKGVYSCNAENRFGKASASGSLTVRDKTQIRTEPVSEMVDYTNQVTFTCGATTDNEEMKNLKYRWLKDGAPLPDDSRYEIEAGVVIISNTQSKDTGSYTCVAENGLDNDTATATLQVKAPPDPPYDVERDECLAKKAILMWKFDDSMKNFDKMLRFIVEYQTDYAPDTWIKIKSVEYDDKKVTIPLSPYAEYKFRVKAVNNMGISKPSEPSEICETPMAAPDTNPENVRTDQQYTGYLVIRWKPMDQLQLNGPEFQYVIEVQDLDKGETKTYTVKNYKESHYKIKVDDVYRPYRIGVQAQNQVGVAMSAVNKIIGRSGESVPTVIPKNFELDPDVNVTATMAGFQWEPVDTSPEAIRGKFQGYKIRYWKKGEKATTLHEQFIEAEHADGQRAKRQAEKVKGKVINLPSFSDIVADVVVLNSHFESEGSNKVNLSTPEGVPGKVRFFETLTRGSSHIDVQWEGPEQPNGVLLGYQLSYEKVNNLFVAPAVIVNDTIPPEQKDFTISDLEPDTTYRFSIKARTKMGWGEERFIDISTASDLMAISPPVIDDILPLDNEVNVSWTLEIPEKGSRIGLMYYLQYRKKGDKDWKTSPDIITNKLWAQLDHLDPGTVYQVKVIAMSDKDGKTTMPSKSEMFHTSGIARRHLQEPSIQIMVRGGSSKTKKASIKKREDTTTTTVLLTKMTTRSGNSDPLDNNMNRVKEKEEHTLAGAARASFLTAAWFIGMMIAIAFLILILIIVCIIKRNRGDNYPVQEKERLRGNCDDAHDQFNGFGKGSDENGIGGSSSFDCDGEKVPLDVDADSMDYGDDDASKFNEDGSFIGQYGRGDKANDVANVSASSIV